MVTRILSLALLLTLPTLSNAEPLSKWLKAQLEATLDNAGVPASVRNELLADAVQHTEGYTLADIDSCYLDNIANYLIPHTTQDALHTRVDLVRFSFVRQLVTTLHSQAYERVSGTEVDEQISELAAALRSNIAENYPEFVDDAFLHELEQGWADRMFRLSDSCTVRLMKAPMPVGSFKELLHTVRALDTSEDFHARPLLEERRRLAGDSTPGERQTQASLEQMLNRTDATPAQREEMTRLILGDLSQRQLQFHIRAIGDRILFDTVQSEWLRHTDHFPEPDEQALQAALERAGVDDAAFEALFESNR